MASLVTDTIDSLEQQIRALVPLARAGELAGIHLEGPWLAESRCGAHTPELLRDPRREDLERLLAAASVVPAVNQIEVHPYLAQDDLRAFDADHEIVTEAWSPIAQGKVLDDPAVVRVAQRYGRTPAQVVLRWHVQRGDVVFPKSVTRSRMEENFALFDFELDGDAMGDLSALDRGERTGPDPDTFDYVPR